METNKDKIVLSIITPCFNSQRFIEGCIKNVIDQNCSSIEHLIMDGGSSDNTVSIIEKYAQKHKHIRWVSEKDRGQSDAMNKGIRMAKGEIMTYLNVDDYFEPGVLNRVLKLFVGLKEPSMLVGGLNVRDSSDEILRISKVSKLKLYSFLKFWEGDVFPGNPSCYFYHRSLHDKIGDFEIENHYAMDYEFFLQAAGNCEMNYIDEIWGNFRFMEGAKTYDNVQSGKHKNIKEEMFLKYRSKLNSQDLKKINKEFRINYKRKSNKRLRQHYKNRILQKLGLKKNQSK